MEEWMERTSGVKSPIQWVGGKYQLAPWIISQMPKHVTYVEPFGGGAHVLIRKAPSKLDVYNDINDSVLVLFRVLADEEKARRLLHAIEFTPCSRKHFKETRDGLYKPFSEDDLNHAYKTCVLAVQSFAGGWQGRQPGWGYKKNSSSQITSWNNFPGRLSAIIPRLKGVQLEHLDFRECIKKYDGPDVLFYCDPPYIGFEKEYRGFCFGEQDHRDLAELLNRIKGKAMLSYYHHALLSELYPGERWRVETKNIPVRAVNPVTRGETVYRDEILLMNFPAEAPSSCLF
jgi:DNA adenine methylase